jgi:hypothetical protein
VLKLVEDSCILLLKKNEVGSIVKDGILKWIKAAPEGACFRDDLS